MRAHIYSMIMEQLKTHILKAWLDYVVMGYEWFLYTIEGTKEFPSTEVVRKAARYC